MTENLTIDKTVCLVVTKITEHFAPCQYKFIVLLIVALRSMFAFCWQFGQLLGDRLWKKKLHLKGTQMVGRVLLLPLMLWWRCHCQVEHAFIPMWMLTSQRITGIMTHMPYNGGNWILLRYFSRYYRLQMCWMR